jgi:hypothetical protein
MTGTIIGDAAVVASKEQKGLWGFFRVQPTGAFAALALPNWTTDMEGLFAD